MKQFRKPSYHIFLRFPLSRYRWRHNLRSPQKIIFLNNCSLCTDQFLIKCYSIKRQGKGDTRQIQNIMKSKLVGGGKCFVLNIVILYIIRKFFQCWIFFTCWIFYFFKRPWSENYGEEKHFILSHYIPFKRLWQTIRLQG